MNGRRQYEVSYTKPDPIGPFVFGPGRNIITGETALRRYLRSEPTSLERDLLVLASSIFAADLHYVRDERENYPRRFSLTIPVVNVHPLQNSRDALERTLFLLSGDSWHISFSPMIGNTEMTQQWPTSSGSTLLFSGGLDSLAHALDMVKCGEQGILVSHDSGNSVIRHSQRVLAEKLSTLSDSRLKHVSLRVSARNQRKGLPFPTRREDSQRTRSFLFVTLAAVVARRSGLRRLLFVAENGQMAIHVPLTEARLGPFSTKTAHPDVLNRMQDLLSTILGVKLTIENPFLYKTKAEVVVDLCREYRSLVTDTVSCWRSSRLPSSLHHCGECVPCLVRRIALERNGIRRKEWHRDLFREKISHLKPDDVGKCNLIELIELVSDFLSPTSTRDLIFRRPELQDPSFDGKGAAAMYTRFAGEAAAVFASYPNVRSLM